MVEPQVGAVVDSAQLPASSQPPLLAERVSSTLYAELRQAFR